MRTASCRPSAASAWADAGRSGGPLPVDPGGPLPVDPRRAIADLRELERRTGGPDSGARRVCWTPEWEAARALLRERLGEIGGVQIETDDAGNLWAWLQGERDETVAVGSHLDSVPGGAGSTERSA